MSNEIDNVMDRIIENLNGTDILRLREHYQTDILQSKNNEFSEYNIFWNDIFERLDVVKLRILLDLRDSSRRCSFCDEPSDKVGPLCQAAKGSNICLTCAEAVSKKLTDDNA